MDISILCVEDNLDSRSMLTSPGGFHLVDFVFFLISSKTHVDVFDKLLGKRASIELLRAVTLLWDSCFDKITHPETRRAANRDNAMFLHVVC